MEQKYDSPNAFKSLPNGSQEEGSALFRTVTIWTNEIHSSVSDCVYGMVYYHETSNMLQSAKNPGLVSCERLSLTIYVNCIEMRECAAGNVLRNFIRIIDFYRYLPSR